MPIEPFSHKEHLAILHALRRRWLYVAIPSWTLSVWLFLSILTTNWLEEYGLAAASLIVLLKVLLFLFPLFIRSATKKQWTILLIFTDLTIFAIISSYLWYWDRGMPIGEHSITETISLVGNSFLFTIILFPLLLIEGINDMLPIPKLLVPYLTGSIAVYWMLMMLVVLYGTEAKRRTQLIIGAILLLVILLTMSGTGSMYELL